MPEGFEPNCTCPNADCPRHGKCKECVAAHREGGKAVPVCLRPLVDAAKKAG